MIIFNEQTKTFFLETKNTSYILRILPSGKIKHVYYGAKIPMEDMKYYTLEYLKATVPRQSINGYYQNGTLLSEYSTFGRGDFRQAAILVETADGRCISELSYKSHEITEGKPFFEGLPQLEADSSKASTLKLTLEDSVSGFTVELYYSVICDADIISRRVRITNVSEENIILHSVASACIDMRLDNYKLLTLEGGWARERNIEIAPLHHGITSIESRCGASSHYLNPFAALVSENADEDTGEVYGFSFVYSGDFKISAEEDRGYVRMLVGLNPETFSWKLAPKENFVTPEVLLTYSNQGIGKMSRNYHDACRGYLGRSSKHCETRPVIINCWEAMYFDMNDQKVKSFIESCKGLGIDTFVLDDGWFGHRMSDNSSLGDWYVCKEKFPEGLTNVSKACKENGLNFGIWFEPEMISPDSDLYRAHPDWCIHSPSRKPIEGRHQLVLDMALPQVVEHTYNSVATILKEYDISYVKWDMNRYITDNGADWLTAECQKEHSHRYILGVYKLMERLTNDFPNVFFEGCAGGGGRVDFGILYYMPQIWTSDDSDACERLTIQYGTSIVYPPSSMVGHVSACPNHQVGRTTPFKTRADVAQMCNFGYELNVSSLSQEEISQIPLQIEKHRQIEPMILKGDFYRLRNPFKGNITAWQLVSKDRSSSFVTVVRKLAVPNDKTELIKLRGLNETAIYKIEQLDISLSGATLMNAGIPVSFSNCNCDFASITFDLQQQN